MKAPSCHSGDIVLALCRVRLWAAAFAVLLAGCGDAGDSGKPKMPASHSKPAAKAKTSKAADDNQKPFTYLPVGKRDPFQSYLAELRAEGETHRNRKLEPTEKFELDQYRLTGLVTGTAQPKAMVEDPENKGYPLRIGSRLGKNGGVVTRITSTGIVVTEEFRAPTGERVRVPIDIKLPQPELDIVAEP